MGPTLLGLALFAIVTAVGSHGILTAVASDVQPEVGHLAPDFALPDIDAKTVRLSDYRGKKAVFLNFWAIRCPSCRAEMPTMEKAYQRYKEQVGFLAVSIDKRSKDVEAFTKEFKLTFPALLDSGRWRSFINLG
mgnify:CR=1 FL=1